MAMTMTVAMALRRRVGVVLCLAAAAASPGVAQSLNFDFGAAPDGPPASYGAAGHAGTWNSIPALHGTTTGGLVDIHGVATGVTIRQIGGFEVLVEHDPAVTGADDALLLDDFLVTYNASLESCIYLDGMAPGRYEVLVYARMPDPAIGSYTSVDQEPGFPHYDVGGAWPGSHTELVSYSRHEAVVGPTGDLDLHSGVVPGANPALGAALNGLQVFQITVFSDGFESGAADAWVPALP